MYLPVAGSCSSSLSGWCFPVNWLDNRSSLQSLCMQQTLFPSRSVWLQFWKVPVPASLMAGLGWLLALHEVLSLGDFWSCSFLPNPQMTYEKNKAFPSWADGLQGDTGSGRAGCANDFSKVPLSSCQQCHFQKVNPVARQQGKVVLTMQHYPWSTWKL